MNSSQTTGVEQGSTTTIQTKKSSIKNARIVVSPPVLLPEAYVPKDTDIVCGRGKAFRNHPGNRMFVQIIRSSLQEYENAEMRRDKSAVVYRVLQSFHNDHGLRFLKCDKKEAGSTSITRYSELPSGQAYIKVGHAIRDFLKLQTGNNAKNNNDDEGPMVGRKRARIPSPDVVQHRIDDSSPPPRRQRSYIENLRRSGDDDIAAGGTRSENLAVHDDQLRLPQSVERAEEKVADNRSLKEKMTMAMPPPSSFSAVASSTTTNNKQDSPLLEDTIGEGFDGTELGETIAKLGLSNLLLAPITDDDVFFV